MHESVFRVLLIGPDGQRDENERFTTRIPRVAAEGYFSLLSRYGTEKYYSAKLTSNGKRIAYQKLGQPVPEDLNVEIEGVTYWLHPENNPEAKERFDLDWSQGRVTSTRRLDQTGNEWVRQVAPFVSKKRYYLFPDGARRTTLELEADYLLWLLKKIVAPGPAVE